MVEDPAEVVREEVRRLEGDLQHAGECRAEDDPAEADLRQVEVLGLEEEVLEVVDQVADLWARSAVAHLAEVLRALDLLVVDLS